MKHFALISTLVAGAFCATAPRDSDPSPFKVYGFHASGTPHSLYGRVELTLSYGDYTSNTTCTALSNVWPFPSILELTPCADEAASFNLTYAPAYNQTGLGIRLDLGDGKTAEGLHLIDSSDIAWIRDPSGNPNGDVYGYVGAPDFDIDAVWA